MSMHRSLFHSLSIVVILSMSFSGITPSRVSAQGPDGIERQVNAQTGKVSFIGPENGTVLPASDALGKSNRPHDPALALAKRFGPEFGLGDPERDLSEIKSSRADNGRITARYQQNYQGVPVMGGELIVNTNDNGDLYSISGEMSSALSLSTQPAISSTQARQTALKVIAKWYQKTPEDFVASEPGLWIYDESLLRPSPRPAELVWRMEVTAKDSAMPLRELVLVHAQRGSISLHYNQVDTAWSVQGSDGTVQDPDLTPTPTETPLPAETPEATSTGMPTEEIITTEDVSVPEASSAGAASPDGAIWYVATTGNNSNSCSISSSPCLTINGAITKAAAGDIIRVASGTYMGTATSGNIVVISKSITLSGGWNSTFTVQNGVSTIDGDGFRNSIVANATGSLVVVESFIIQNSYSDLNGAGITIYRANFTLKNSSVINNIARGRGAGIYISTNATLTVLNSTISGNKASASGGGIYAVDGTVSINNSTIVYNNSNETGGGIAGGNSTISIKNSLLARNIATGGSPDCAGSITTSTHNIIGSASGCTVTGGAGDQLNIDPLIDASLSGVIPFHALQVASPAINAGDNNTCLVIDQRNIPRPQGSACDIGAYESTEEGRLLAVSGSDQITTSGSPFPAALTVHLLDSSANPVSGVVVTFTAPPSGASGTFADTANNITTATTDSNGRASAAIFTANTSRGPYSISATADGYSDVANFLLTNIHALFVATTGSDSNTCTEPSLPCLTINSAINKAAPGDRVVVATGTYTGPGTEVVLINKNINLSGGWANAFSTQAGTSIIDGQGARRGIAIDNTNVVIDRFTIQNGFHNSSGGGINKYGGVLTLNHSVVTRNVSQRAGGGISNYGTLTINDTTISHNRAGSFGSPSGGGAGINHSGGTAIMNNSTINNNVVLGTFYASGILTGNNNNTSFILNNSTVTGNTGGDAIYSSVGTLTLHNSTVSNNTGLGIRNTSGTVILENSILANNSTAVSGQDCSGAVTSAGYNLISKISGCTFTPVTGDQTDVNPRLSTALIGNPPYQPLSSSSPAIDAGNPETCLSIDQRGMARPQGPRCDTGAYEYTTPGAAAAFGITSGNNQRISVSLQFPSPLVVYVVDDSGSPASDVNVTFSAPASGPSGTFADSGTNTTVVPTNPEGVAVSSMFTANSQYGTYEVVATASGLSGSVSFVLTNSTLFVSPTGNDGNSCSLPTEPCLTIDGAINKAAEVDVIKVAVGTYASANIVTSQTISGGWDTTFSSQIGYSTITGYSAVIADAPNISLSRFIVQNSHYGIYHSRGVLRFDQGALLHNDIGIHNSAGDTTFTNTTISGNHGSSGSGSAIMNMNGNIRIQYSTVTNNTGDYAIRSLNTDSAHIEIGNSILAGNSVGDCYNPYRNLVSTGHNLFGSSPACSGSSYFVPDPTDQLGTDPKLSPLLPVGYHPISSNSPAIGNADPDSCPATDQRGVARPQGNACDIGAYEYTTSGTAASFGIGAGSDQHSGPSLPFIVPLAVYVVDLSGNPVSGVNVTFTAPASGPSGTFADTGTTTTSATTNEDGFAIASVFTANSQPGSYSVTATASGLTGSVSFALTNAAWFVSPTGRDSNSCNVPSLPCLTIYGAIQKAVNGDAILVAVGTYGTVTVTKSVSILGGWNSTFSSQIGTSTIDGNVTNHGIYANAPTIFFSRFVVQNSNFGIQHTAGTLSFERGALINNNNGFYNSGGEATLTNTTISGNDAADTNGFGSPGSAIRNLGGFVRVHYSTITGNTGDYAVHNGNSSAHIEIGNSILAGNDVGDCYIDSNSMTSAGHNILGNSPACSGPKGFIPDPTDQLGTDPKLSILLPGGYHALLPNSPAVGNAELATCPATDQRGMTRPQGEACDSGAYEYAVPGAAAFFGIISGSNQHSGPSQSFPLPLAVYVIDASGSPVAGVNVTFTAPASGPSGTFANTGTNTTTIITNAGGLATSPVFTANSQLGAYNVTTTVSGLTGSVSFALVNAAWFVSPAGSDGNSCNVPTSPCLTINAAINKATNGDAIKVAVGTYSPVVILKNLTIFGGWDSSFNSQVGYSTVDGNFTSHGISVGGQNVSISRFIIQNSEFGIYHSGTGTLRFERGASINNNNGIRNESGTTLLTNTTISGNHAGDTDGYVYGGSAISVIHGRVTVQYSTITNNGGTEAISLVQTDAYLEIGNSILAGNPRWDCDGEETMTSLGHNIFGSSPPCQHPGSVFVPDPTDQVGVDPKLGALFPRGYHPLMLDSPAIDAADPLDCPAVDQRGVMRPVGANCDIGAFEYTPTATAARYILTYDGSPQIILVNTTASLKLKAIVLDEDGDSVQGKTVTFTAPRNGASIVFADTGTNSSSAMTDEYGIATSSVFAANNTSGMYLVEATVSGADTRASFALSNSTIVLNPQVRTYTANNYISLPGTFLCNQTKPGCTNRFDLHADAAHKYAIGIYSLYAIEHSRNSLNNFGMTIVSSVHYSSAYANAIWTGSQMVYGDTYDFPLADDVVAHELTHGVTQYESDLFYYYQSGAINESFSDLWGEYYDQMNGLGNDTANVKWFVGEDVSDLGAIRSMSNPPAYSDPDKMSSSNYYTGKSDNGGVHSNSGINNKAVSLLVDGGSFNGKTVAALGWKKTAAIYYEVNTNLLSSGADYSDLYYALQQACSNLVGQKGITTADCAEVKDAGDAVEMNGQPIANFNEDAPYCDQGNVRTIVFSDDLEAGTGNWTFTNGEYPRWQFGSPYGRYAHSGNHFLFADDYPGEVTDASARLISIIVPPNAYLRFAHAYDFEAYEPSEIYDDGGVLEYSVDDGSTWNDAGSLIDFNGYKGTLRDAYDNPLEGRSAFVGSSHGYISTRLNLASLAGETVSFRWRMGLDGIGYAWGWWLDDIQLYDCSSPDLSVYIAGTFVDGYDIPPGGSKRVSYSGMNSGPVKLAGTNSASILGAERVIYKVDGVNTSFTEMMALPNSQLDTTYWLPWYNNKDLDTQLRFANVSASPATVHVWIGGSEMTGSPFQLAAGASTRVSFAGVNNGPVKLQSNANIVASERLIYKVNGVATSFSETMAVPNQALDTTYWLPWYNNKDLDTQLRFANVSSSPAQVHVFIGDVEMQGSPFPLAAGESTRKSFPGINNGPVQIVSDQDIVAAERLIYKVNGVNTSFTEMMALPNSQLDTTYWLPWYNNKDLDTQLRFANVHDTQTATVHVYIGGVEMPNSPFTLLPGESTRQSFPNINNGPVQIVSDVPIVAAERLIYKVNNIATSFSEMMALPASQLDTAYWLPWYNNVDLDTQLRFGIP